MQNKGTLPFESIHEIVYHTWIITASHHTFIYTGTPAGVKKAKAWVQERYPPAYTVKVKKVA